MVTIVPKDVYEKLNKSVSEAETRKTAFSFKDFQSKVFHYSYVRYYLQDKEVDFVGEGSGRLAFMIPKGSSLDAKHSAVCLKVAKNMRGIAQNKAEVDMISKFKNYPCVPEIFAYDKAANIALELELGRNIDESDLVWFFSDWIKEVKANKFTQSKDGILDSIRTANDIYEYIASLREIQQSGLNGKIKLWKIIRKMDAIASKNKKYVPFVSLFKVLFRKGGLKVLEVGDFGAIDNWAFINRDNVDVLVPIDWGFTKEVANKYYI